MSLKDINAFEEDPTASYTADSDFLQALCHFFRRYSRPGGGGAEENEPSRCRRKVECPSSSR